mmetsp:Transcript_46552/g.149560  ORF Transcript_46552/g.149560 Transcript_46552/m.149560 type:complete len:236 (+) Transcript_46552:573-1280(+)
MCKRAHCWRSTQASRMRNEAGGVLAPAAAVRKADIAVSASSRMVAAKEPGGSRPSRWDGDVAVVSASGSCCSSSPCHAELPGLATTLTSKVGTSARQARQALSTAAPRAPLSTKQLHTSCGAFPMKVFVMSPTVRPAAVHQEEAQMNNGFANKVAASSAEETQAQSRISTEEDALRVGGATGADHAARSRLPEKAAVAMQSETATFLKRATGRRPPSGDDEDDVPAPIAQQRSHT